VLPEFLTRHRGRYPRTVALQLVYLQGGRLWRT
jgi:hypothetical protein